ncbi:MAG: ComF family protein [Treponema sp.]|nr:ComF family protein [Treponema sp.]
MKKIYFEIKQIVVSFLRLFYALICGQSECAVCGKSVFSKPVCKACLEKYFSVKKIFEVQRCERCGKELISEQKLCTKCRQQTVLKSTDKIIPLYSYRLWNRELMFRWKMLGERSLSPIFAKLMNNVLKQSGQTVLIPIPPRKGKIRKQGWDQIDELCQFLEKRYGFTVLKILERNSVVQQKTLSRTERLQSIKSAYSLCKTKLLNKRLKSFGGILPESVCLIDDVCTTGATLESCAEILKSAGVKTVNAVTLFTVD